MRDPLDTPLTIIPREMFVTVYAPGVVVDGCVRRKCTVHTSDWREKRGSPGNTHGATAEPTATLREVLTRPYSTPALCTGYVVARDGVALPHSPRVAKSGVPWVRSQGLDVVTTCFVADVDTPGHLPWTPERRAEWERLWASAPAPLRTVAANATAKGLRLFQPLRDPVPVDRVEPHLHAWYDMLVRVGIWATVLECKDWSHIFRVANHVKDGGARFASDWVSFERCEAIDPPPPLAGALAKLARRPRKLAAQPPEGGAVSTPAFAEECPAGWTIAADAVGAAIRDTVRSDWRRCYLALAGALLEHGCEPAALPAVVARAHTVDPRWADLLQNRTAIARSTALRWLSGQECAGWRVLSEAFAGVAEALERALGDSARVVARVRRKVAAPAPRHVPAAEASEVLAKEIRDAYGVTFVAGPPGLGKTQSILDQARRLPVINGRARPGDRLALGTPHHALALQIRRDVPERSRRLFGPLAHRQPDGSHTCIHHDAAASLAEGGQSIEWEFCKGRGKSPCERFEACEARVGSEGPDAANLVVGPHEKLAELDAAAGTAGLLVVDEPAGVVATEAVTLDQLDTARRFLDAFVPRYARAIGPALAAFDAWVRTSAPADNLLDLPAAVRAGASAVAVAVLEEAGVDPALALEERAEAIVELASSAILADAKSKAPPILWTQMVVARRSPARARELGAASRVLDLLWRGLVARPAHGVRVDARGGGRRVMITGIEENLARAVRRVGPLVLLGADVGLHVPAVAKLLGYAPRFVDLRVADGAPVSRTIYATATATRKRWCPHGAPDWSGGFLQALKVALSWAAESEATRVLAVMTWAVFAAVIGHALDPDAAGPRDLWKASDLSAAALEEARALVAPILSSWRGTILVGHYHSLRGLNYMRDADAGVTLGDPRPNVGQVEDQALYLELDPFGRADALAAAEVEQAHGRLRTIHRTKPARLCHIGEIVNPSWRGALVDVREMPGGRPRTIAAMTGEELRAIRDRSGLSLRAFAAELEVTKSTVERWEKGEGRGASVPAAVALRARSLGLVVPQTPDLSITPRGGFAGQSPLLGVCGTDLLQGVCGTDPRERSGT